MKGPNNEAAVYYSSIGLKAALSKTGGHIPQAVIHLTRRAAHNQADNGILGHSNIAMAPQDVDLGVGKDDAGAGGVLDGVLGLTALAGETADGTGEVLTVQGLHVLDFEGVDKHVLETQKNHGILEK